MPPATSQHLQHVSPLLQGPQPTVSQQPCTTSEGTSDSVRREDAQAEVRRQLSGVLGQLQEERLRAENALAQAQRMRQQLERERTRAAGGDLSGMPDGVPVFPVTRQDDGGFDGHVGFERSEGRDAGWTALPIPGQGPVGPNPVAGGGGLTAINSGAMSGDRGKSAWTFGSRDPWKFKSASSISWTT